MVTLDRIDAVPIASNQEFDPQFLQWLWVLVDTLNENLSDIQNSLNFLTANNLALKTETVTLTSGSPSFTVVDGTLYKVGYNVIGAGIPAGATILTIAINVITLDMNAILNGAHALTFIPAQDDNITNGILLYDTTNNVYVGMQNGSLVKFTTTAYP